MGDELTPQQHALILEISKDFYRYAKNNLYIKNKDAEIVIFDPNIAQRVLIDRVLELLVLGKPIRLIVLKARQMGLSTAIEAIIYWYTSTHKNISAMIVGHEDTSSKNLYNMFKRYYENSNVLFKPTRKYDTKTDLTFQREDADGNQIGLNSVIKTATAKNVSAGRSDTIQLLHGSEIGEWEHGEELVASLLQTVPVRPNTMIFLESTANGRGNFFYKQWQESVKGETVFEPFFFPWWLHEEYQMDGEIGQYTVEEEEIIEIIKDGIDIAGKHYTVDWESISRKIAFRRYKEREFRATPERLYQEYPSTAHEAFIATGRPVFNIKALSYMEKQCDKHLFQRYELVQEQDRTISAVLSDDLAPLKIWDMPERGEEYVIGADPAEGLANGDFSVADVIRVKDLKTVAKIRGHIDPDLFGHFLDKLGRFYNNALLGVEINNHGLAVVQRLRDLFYTNLYRREKGIDERFEESTSKLGWKTDMRTKPLAIDYLAEAIRELYITDYDIVFIEEAFSYVRDDNGRTNAEEGNHDDTVMAKAIALQTFEWSNNNKSDLRAYVSPKMIAIKNKHKVIK
jgi:hypothetical protein